MLGWLNSRAVLTEQGEKNRGRLLAAGPLIEASEVYERDISQIVNAWMYSSYASSPQKHDIKKYFNRLLRRLMPWEEPPFSTKSDLLQGDKPVILVINERLTEVHAMYRCYAPSIRKLSRYFNVVGMAEEGHIDDVGRSLFDKVMMVPKQKI